MINTTPRVVVIVDDDKPMTEFHIGHYSVRRDLRTTDLASAAEEAVADYHASMSNYPSLTYAGVASGEMDDVDFSYPGSLISPDRFVWFEVRCRFEPYYHTRKVQVKP